MGSGERGGVLVQRLQLRNHQDTYAHRTLTPQSLKSTTQGLSKANRKPYGLVRGHSLRISVGVDLLISRATLFTVVLGDHFVLSNADFWESGRLQGGIRVLYLYLQS